MSAILEKAFGYQGDNMHLPAGDLSTALPFYETVQKEISEFNAEPHGGGTWTVFYVVAPDRLC